MLDINTYTRKYTFIETIWVLFRKIELGLEALILYITKFISHLKFII